MAASLAALRLVTDRVTAVVTVADDGGSSGRLRDEFNVLPPGDLRMALAALCDDRPWGQIWRDVLQHRFGGDGPLGGHATVSYTHLDVYKRQLLGVLQGLVVKGNTVIVIEHNLDVIKSADWIVDLGPEGGSGGGRVVAEGTPEQVAAHAASHTGRFLAPVLAKAAAGMPSARPSVERASARPRKATAVSSGTAKRAVRGRHTECFLLYTSRCV